MPERVEFLAAGRHVPGEDDYQRARRVHTEASLRADYRKVEREARNWSHVVAGDAVLRLFEMWEALPMDTGVEDLMAAAAQAGRAERAIRAIIAEKRRQQMLVRVVEAGIAKVVVSDEA